VPEGARLANKLPCDIIIFEGSGSSMPPIATDAWILAIGAHQPVEYITGYMGPYRIRKSDLCVLTMCEEPLADRKKIDEMATTIKQVNPATRVIKTIFRPKSLEKIKNEKVILTTTAPAAAGPAIKESLEREYGCEIVGISHNLSNRPKLRADLTHFLATEKPTVLLTEVKAAAIDVATAIGLENGLRVVYADNIPIPLEGEPSLAEAALQVAQKAVARFSSKEKR
jgi:cyclic 2,3-diphosphoglycerate synthetase